MKSAYETMNLLNSSKEFDNEACFELDEFMLYGGICEIAMTVKQDSGAEKELTVAYDAIYLSFEVKGANIDRDTMNPQTLIGGEEFFEIESGMALEKTVSFVIPKYTSDFKFIIKCDGKFTIEKLVVNAKPCESANYAEMIGNSLRGNGNNSRIKAVIEKAKAGEDVTLAYLGGSITEGFAASETKNSDCYAEKSYQMFREAYGKGDGSNVHFINAGMSGTSSALGVIRYERDVIRQVKYGEAPDILFVDYAVNDGDDAETYEAIIRNALSQGSAVVLMFVLYAGGSNHEEKYVKIGETYNLYMVSPGQGQRIGCADKKAFDDWFYWLENGNYGHPDVGGHRYMADCIMNMFNVADVAETEEDNISNVFDIMPSNDRADLFIGMKTLESDSTLIAKKGGFNCNDDAQPTLQYIKDGVKDMKWFPKEMAHTAMSGNESFVARIKCNTLMIAYKQAGSDFGKADVYVDGKLITTLSNSNGGWNNAYIDKIFVSNEIKEHEIEIKMAAGDDDKPFTIYAMGYTDTVK